MSEIPDPRVEQIEKLRDKTHAEAASLANCYARVFLGDADGVRVLDDLRKCFGCKNVPVFKPPVEGAQYDPIRAALIDGQRQVIVAIENALMNATNPNIKPKTT